LLNNNNNNDDDDDDDDDDNDDTTNFGLGAVKASMPFCCMTVRQPQIRWAGRCTYTVIFVLILNSLGNIFTAAKSNNNEQ